MLKQLFIQYIRQPLAQEVSLIPVSLLAIITGLLTGLVIQCFRFALEWPLLFGYEETRFVDAPRFLAPLGVLAGSLCLGLIFHFLTRPTPSMGISHVVEQVADQHGKLPLKPAILQFFSAVWCILIGQSSGREGPAVHLGAASSSLFAQYLKLPHNSWRIFAGCGTASAIASSFNTPIAGVIFAMEVILMEYSVMGFIPVILAASSGTIISHWVYGDAPAFAIQPLLAHDLHEIPIYMLIGLLAGFLAAGFCYLSKILLRLARLSAITRFSLAGLATAALGLFVPEIFGIGYFIVPDAFQNTLPLSLLCAIVLAKLLATCTAQGLGMPIGIIGPSLVAGACLGSAVFIVTNYFFDAGVPDDSLYPMIAMGTMMSAVLNAPLAALMALMELTSSTKVIFPAMIGIVIANLTCIQVFKQRPPHISRLIALRQWQGDSAMQRALRDVGVTRIMTTHIAFINETITMAHFHNLQQDSPDYLVVQGDSHRDEFIISGKDFFLACHNAEYDNNRIHILSLPVEHRPLVRIEAYASLYEAYALMDEKTLDILLVTGFISHQKIPKSGIITRKMIERQFHKPRVY